MLKDLLQDTDIANGKKLNARERSRLETRKRLLLAGAKQFSENGFEQTSISSIAEEAEVATGTIFFHFKNKEGLFRAIGIYYMAELHSRLEESDKIPTDTWEENIKNHAETAIDYIDENRGVFSLIINRLMMGSEFGKEISEAMVAEQEERFEEGIKEGIFRDDVNLKVAAQATIAMQFSTASWWLNSRGNISKEEFIDTMTKLRSSMLSTAKKS